MTYWTICAVLAFGLLAPFTRHFYAWDHTIRQWWTTRHQRTADFRYAANRRVLAHLMFAAREGTVNGRSDPSPR